MSNQNTCVVCGRLSNRASWNNTINTVDGTGFQDTYVACDFHSLPEIEMAILILGINIVQTQPAVEQIEIDPGIDESAQV